ncbi:MAG TPA: hypothetical protein VNN17_03390 [Terriglobia bacterium]|nr:hypothetical protein [Terriglobia bacterium]
MACHRARFLKQGTATFEELLALFQRFLKFPKAPLPLFDNTLDSLEDGTTFLAARKVSRSESDDGQSRQKIQRVLPMISLHTILPTS